MTQSFNSDFANDRRNTNVDRSLEATLAREEAGLNDLASTTSTTARRGRSRSTTTTWSNY